MAVFRKGKRFSIRSREKKERKTCLFLPRTRAPEFLSPSLSKACHSDFLFFLIVYDVVVTCASFLYPHIIERKEINQSILKLCFVLSSFFLPSFLELFKIFCSFAPTFYFNFSAKPFQCVRQWRASALGMHTTLWFPLQKLKKKNITQLSSPQSPYTQI